MAANLKLPKMESPTVNQHLYQSMLGSLMYVAIGTQPNIMFTVHCLSQYSIAPGEKHLNAMKHCRWDNGPISELPTETELMARACHYHCPEICYEFDMQKLSIPL